MKKSLFVTLYSIMRHYDPTLVKKQFQHDRNMSRTDTKTVKSHRLNVNLVQIYNPVTALKMKFSVKDFFSK